MNTESCWLLSDAALCRRLLNFLFTQSQLHSCELEICVLKGQAIVSGRVASWQQERILTGCCQRVAGIREVVSDISVSAEAESLPVSLNGSNNLPPTASDLQSFSRPIRPRLPGKY